MGSEMCIRDSPTSNSNSSGKQYKSQAHADDYCCPECGAPGLRIDYPDIRCFACGWSEPLIDFPISWDWHRHYCVEYGLPDPGPCEPPEHPELKAIEERLESIEQTLTGLTPEDLRQLKMKRIYDEVQDIRHGFRRIDRIVAQAITKPKTGKSRGVKL